MATVGAGEPRRPIVTQGLGLGLGARDWGVLASRCEEPESVRELANRAEVELGAAQGGGAVLDRHLVTAALEAGGIEARMGAS